MAEQHGDKNSANAIEAICGPSHLVKIDDGQSVHVRTAKEWLDLARDDFERRRTPSSIVPTGHRLGLIKDSLQEAQKAAMHMMAVTQGESYAFWQVRYDEATAALDALDTLPSAIAPKTGAVYLVDGKPHRMCDCDPMKGDCPRGNERQLQTAQLSRCLVPAEGVLIVGQP